MRAGFLGPCAGGGLTAAAILFGVGAVAQPSGVTPVRIEYDAPAQCPDEVAFRSQLTSRTRSARIAEPGELARSLRIVVRLSKEGAHAELHLTDIDGQRVRREVQAATCAEALSAIALVAALAVEARSDEPDPQAPQQPREPPGPSPLTTPTQSADPTPKSPEGSQPVEPARGFWLLGIGAGFETGVAPDGAYLLRLFGGMRPGSAPLELRLGATYGEGGAVRDGGLLRFRGAWGRADACWLALELSNHGALAPCAGVEGGAIWARGLKSPPRIEEPKSTTVPWAAAVLFGRLRLVEAMFFAEAQAELIVPLFHHTFDLERPRARVHEFPDVALAGALAVGVLIE